MREELEDRARIQASATLRAPFPRRSSSSPPAAVPTPVRSASSSPMALTAPAALSAPALVLPVGGPLDAGLILPVGGLSARHGGPLLQIRRWPSLPAGSGAAAWRAVPGDGGSGGLVRGIHLGEGRRRRWKRGWEAMEKAVEANRTRRKRFGRRTMTTRRCLAVLAWASVAVAARTIDAAYGWPSARRGRHVGSDDVPSAGWTAFLPAIFLPAIFTYGYV